MDLNYPKDFGEEAKNNVIRAQVSSRRTLEQSRAKWMHGNDRPPATLLLQYIMSIFAAFSKEACEIGRTKGSAEWVVKECRKFLYWLADKTAREHDFEEYRLPSPCGNVNSHELNRFFQKMVEASREWAKYEDDLLEVAQAQRGVASNEELATEHQKAKKQSVEKAELILKMLMEGSSVATVARITGAHSSTILKVMVLAGEKCERIMATKVINVRVRDVELDEVWSYVGCKQRHLKKDDDPNRGDCYTFVAIERHSKLVLNIAMGKRNQQTTDVFVEGVRHATANAPFQVTTDGFPAYKSAITTTLHDRCDYAMLIKVYKAASEGEGRYSPAEVASVVEVPVMGRPDSERVCTSIVERSNLSLRMGIRRFTRLTNAFSKKWENHWAAVACWYTFYNFCRVHKSLRVTPAMAAGIADHIWTVRELLEAA